MEIILRFAMALVFSVDRQQGASALIRATF
jgi:hypothetical protein